MTTESGTSAAERRGLSRRQMIKASAVAGAAAWTAPMIIDSLASPAAAVSGCKTYYIKYKGDGTQCFTTSAQPHCSTTTKIYTNNNASDAGAGSACGAPQQPTFLANQSYNGGTYQKITLQSGCTFAATPTWIAVGEYGSGEACAPIPSGAINAVPTGNSIGLYEAGGTKAYLNKTNSSQPLDWLYLQFVCCGTTTTSPPTTGGGGHEGD